MVNFDVGKILSLNICLSALSHSLTDTYFLKFKEGGNRKTKNLRNICIKVNFYDIRVDFFMKLTGSLESG